MPLVSNEFELRPLDTLFVDRATRQRQDIFTPEGEFINSDGLCESVAARGVLSPLLVKRSGEIIYGERRFEAAKRAGLAHVPVRYAEDLSPSEAKLIELEENTRRRDLSWRDQARAIAELHALYAELNGASPDAFPASSTADIIDMSAVHVRRNLRVAEDLDNPRLANATGISQAYNLLVRQDERLVEDIVEDITQAAKSATTGRIGALAGGPIPVYGGGDGATLGGGPQEAHIAGVEGHAGDPTNPIADPTSARHGRPLAPSNPPPPILCANFLDFAPSYAGPRFNFIHCDFPYGQPIGGQQREQIDKMNNPYADSRELYEALISALCANLDRLCAASAHIVFWLNADFSVHQRTRAMFAQLAPSLAIWERPLIWHKTDSVSVLADASRLPRYSYETALVLVREDRKIIKAVHNAYGAPTDKRLHPSTKPEPMLKHFFGMFIDAHSRVFDPTAGGGSALRACDALGAESVLGLEVDAAYAHEANKAIASARALRSAAREMERTA